MSKDPFPKPTGGTFRKDPLRQMLDENPANERAGKPVLRHARAIRRSLTELMTSTADPLLAEGHDYDWVTVDGATASGLMIVVSLGGPILGSPSEVVTVTPGVPVWVRGKPVYVFGATAAGITYPSDVSGSVVFWATAGQVPPSGAPRLVEGSVAKDVNARQVLTAGSEVEVLSSADMMHAIGLPLLFDLSLAGGAYEDVAFSYSALIPAELRLYLYDDSDASLVHTDVWPFPGHGRARVRVPLPRNRPRLASDSLRWRLCVALPAGAAASLEVSLVGQVVVGSCEPYWNYWFGLYRNPAAPAVNTIYGYHARRRLIAHSDIERVTLNATDATAVLTYRTFAYVPPLLGGPITRLSGAATVTGTYMNAALNTAGEFETHAVYFTGSMTSSGEFLASLAGV